MTKDHLRKPRSAAKGNAPDLSDPLASIDCKPLAVLAEIQPNVRIVDSGSDHPPFIQMDVADTMTIQQIIELFDSGKHPFHYEGVLARAFGAFDVDIDVEGLEVHPFVGIIQIPVNAVDENSLTYDREAGGYKKLTSAQMDKLKTAAKAIDNKINELGKNEVIQR